MQAVLPTGELECTGQSKQAEFPIKLLYFPVLHFSQTTPDSIHPILHTHAAGISFGRNTVALVLYDVNCPDTHHSERKLGRSPAFIALLYETPPCDSRNFTKGHAVGEVAI